MKQPPLVRITWLDTTGHDGWQDVKAAVKRKPARVRSVGYLLAELDDRVIICQDLILADKSAHGVGVYPRGMVESIEYL